MKYLLKKIIPSIILDFYAKKKYSKSQSPFFNKDAKTVFTNIYNSNKWNNNESVSGIGSTIENTTKIVSVLNNVFHQLEIKTLLDIPCGDFNWIKNINLNEVNYTGADIVPELIDSNIKSYSNLTINFKELNLIKDSLPQSDLILVRDCFVHFSYDDINNSMKNICASNSKYLMVTTFTKHNLNYDITTGDWRPINLEKAPFNFPKPILIIEEQVHPEYIKETKGKSLSIWKIDDLKLSLNA
jgi:hypothetical protein